MSTHSSDYSAELQYCRQLPEIFQSSSLSSELLCLDCRTYNHLESLNGFRGARPTADFVILGETFGGTIAIVVQYSVGSTLVDRFGDYMSDVRGFFQSK